MKNRIKRVEVASQIEIGNLLNNKKNPLQSKKINVDYL